MTNAFVILMVAALAIPAAAVEYELTVNGVRSVAKNVPSVIADVLWTFESRTENELYHDNGEAWWSHYSMRGLASTYTAPSDCYLITLKYYLKNAGHTYYHDCYGDSGGTPDDTSSYFSDPIEYIPDSEGWHEIDVAAEGVTFTNGEVFHPFMDTYTVVGTSDTQGTITGGSGGPAGSNWRQHTDSTWTADEYDFGAALVRVIINDDMDGPYVDGLDPADGGWGTPDTDIVFHCKDDDKGVDSGTIDFSADDGTRADVSGTLDIDDGDPNDMTCTFTPDNDLPVGETITCTVAGALADGLGNEMGDDVVWSFTVGYLNVEEASLGEIKAGYH